jgi:hypothetical protein
MTTAPQESAAAVLDVIEVEVDVEICNSCPHARDAHDAIAARYCAASHDTGTVRGCICHTA